MLFFQFQKSVTIWLDNSISWNSREKKVFFWVLDIWYFKSIAMKIFESFRILFKPIGINDTFNSKIVIAFLFLSFYAIFSCAFFLFKSDKTFTEFVQSFYVSVSTIAYFSYFVTISLKKANLLKFMTDLEDFVGKREWISFHFFFNHFNQFSVNNAENLDFFLKCIESKWIEDIQHILECFSGEIFRLRISKVENDLWSSERNGWEMDENFSLCVAQNEFAWHCDAKLYNQLCPLLRNGFGTWSISPSTSNVVNNWSIFCDSNSSFTKKKFIIAFIHLYIQVAVRLENTIRIFTSFHRSIHICLLRYSANDIPADILHYIVLDIDGHHRRC